MRNYIQSQDKGS